MLRLRCALSRCLDSRPLRHARPLVCPKQKWHASSPRAGRGEVEVAPLHSRRPADEWRGAIVVESPRELRLAPYEPSKAATPSERGKLARRRHRLAHPRCLVQHHRNTSPNIRVAKSDPAHRQVMHNLAEMVPRLATNPRASVAPGFGQALPRHAALQGLPHRLCNERTVTRSAR
jgi:hypothetical protein